MCEGVDLSKTMFRRKRRLKNKFWGDIRTSSLVRNLFLNKHQEQVQPYKYVLTVGWISKYFLLTLLYRNLHPPAVGLSTRWHMAAPTGRGKKTSFLLCIPNRNKAVVILTLYSMQCLFNGSWSRHLGKQHRGQNKTGYTFGHAKSASAPLCLQTERG